MDPLIVESSHHIDATVSKNSLLTMPTLTKAQDMLHTSKGLNFINRELFSERYASTVSRNSLVASAADADVPVIGTAVDRALGCDIGDEAVVDDFVDEPSDRLLSPRLPTGVPTRKSITGVI